MFIVHSDIFIIDRKCQLPLVCTKDNIFGSHTAEHEERFLGRSTQCEFLDIFLNAFLNGFTQFMSHLEIAVGWTQPAYALVGTPEIVILHPLLKARFGILKRYEPCFLKELPKNCLPESLDFTKSHRVLRLGSDMLDLILFHQLLKLRLPSPIGILPAIVGQHLAWHCVFRGRLQIHLPDIISGLLLKQAQSDDES
ncbi:MAG: hypothetical protein WCK00_13570 [Deltaproteobacteria bacterium]